MRRTAAVTGLAIAAAIALTACHSNPSETTTGPTSSAAPTATAAPTPRGTVPADNDTVAPAPTAAPTSQQSAADVAVRVMTAYARPDLSAQAWMDGITPYLSQAGAAAYEGTDPAQVPVSTVTGPGTIMPAATAYALNVSVPTNNGTYVVALTRTSTTTPWLADRIIVPGE